MTAQPPREGEAIYLDELDNAQLARAFKTSPWDDYAQELARVRAVISNHALSGDDLTYWFDRERLLKAHLGC